MAAHDMTGPALGSPVLFVVDADPQARAVTESALARRFGRTIGFWPLTHRGAGLRCWNAWQPGGDVALVAADLRLPGMDGVEVLERAHALHPRAARVLLVAIDQHHTQLPFSELAALQVPPRWGGVTFGLAKGWANPEEWLYRQMQDALTGWRNPRHHQSASTQATDSTMTRLSQASQGSARTGRADGCPPRVPGA
jgi:thioredoxin reductase (NADPH)